MIKPWIVSTEQLSWNYDEWLEAYEDGITRTYESSVIEAADELCLLQSQDLDRLLRQSGTTTKEYLQSYKDAIEEGLAVLPINHAGQALCWLGY